MIKKTIIICLIIIFPIIWGINSLSKGHNNLDYLKLVEIKSIKIDNSLPVNFEGKNILLISDDATKDDGYARLYQPAIWKNILEKSGKNDTQILVDKNTITITNNSYIRVNFLQLQTHIFEFHDFKIPNYHQDFLKSGSSMPYLLLF